MRDIRGAARGVFFQLFDNFVKTGAVLIISIYVARTLGPGDFGRLNYASVFASVVYVVVSMGIDAFLAIELAKETNHFLLKKCIQIKLVVSSVVLVFAFVYLYINNVIDWVIVIYLSCVIFWCFNLFEIFFNPSSFLEESNFSIVDSSISLKLSEKTIFKNLATSFL